LNINREAQCKQATNLNLLFFSSDCTPEVEPCANDANKTTDVDVQNRGVARIPISAEEKVHYAEKPETHDHSRKTDKEKELIGYLAGIALPHSRVCLKNQFLCFNTGVHTRRAYFFKLIAPLIRVFPH